MIVAFLEDMHMGYLTIWFIMGYLYDLKSPILWIIDIEEVFQSRQKGRFSFYLSQYAF